MKISLAFINFLIAYKLYKMYEILIGALALVVQSMDNTIRWVNQYPVDCMVCFVNTYPYSPLESVCRLYVVVSSRRHIENLYRVNLWNLWNPQ